MKYWGWIAFFIISSCLSVFNSYAFDLVAEFSKNPTYSNVKISPDGKHFGVEIYADGKRALAILQRDSFNVISVSKFPGSNEVGNYYWVNNNRLVIQVAQSQPWSKEPAYYGELYAVNADGSRGQMIFGYRAGERQVGSNIKKRESVYAWADIIDLLPGDDRRILISSTPMSNSADRIAELLLLDVNNGRTRKVGTAPASYSSFITNKKGELVMSTGQNAKNEREVFIYNAKDNNWMQLPQKEYGRSFFPVAVNEQGDGVYVLDDYKQDKLGLFELKLDGTAYTPIFSDEKVSISSLELTKNTHEVFAMKLDDGRPTYVLLTDKYDEAKIFKNLLATFDGDALQITSKTADDKLWVVYSYSDVNPGQYYLFDRENNSLMKLFDTMPGLVGRELAGTLPISYTSFDGMPIAGYFTPGKGDSANKPLVVNVHGGPHGIRDVWGFDPEVQLLANTGYSVLQVNYRGSAGYGTAHTEAGYLQWGNAIQRDIIAGAEWAIATGKAKAGNLCIMGSSFGGYSAVQSAILAPELFNCVIAVAGIYDLNLMKSEGDIPLRSFGISYLEEVIGSDKQQLEQYSPVNHVSRLKAPLLIAHGKQDRRAPLIHAERLRSALQKAEKPFHWLEFNDETHGFYSPENRQRYYSELLKFLQVNLKQ